MGEPRQQPRRRVAWLDMEIVSPRAPPSPPDRGWRARSGRTPMRASPCRSPPCPRSARRGRGGPRDRPKAFPLRPARGQSANRRGADGARREARRLREDRRPRPFSCEAGSWAVRLERRRRIEPRLDRRPDGGGDLVFAPPGVDDDTTPGLGGGDVEEGAPQGFMESQPLRFEPVGGRPPGLRSAARLRPTSGDKSRISVRSGRFGPTVRRSSAAMNSGGRLPAAP